jgi:hypothetical protein
MTKDDIICMAREAGLQAIYSACDEPNIRYAYENWDDELEHFANLITKHILAKSYHELVSLAAKHAAETVAAAEREACAVIAFNAQTYLEAAAAIRARGQHD